MSSILEFFKMNRREGESEFNRLRADFDQKEFDDRIAEVNKANRELMTDDYVVNYDDIMTFKVIDQNGLKQAYLGVKVGNANDIRANADGLKFDFSSELSTPIVYFPGLNTQDGTGTTIAFGVDDYAVYPEGENYTYPVTRKRILNIFSDISAIDQLQSISKYKVTAYYGKTNNALKTTIGDIKDIERYNNSVAKDEFDNSISNDKQR